MKKLTALMLFTALLLTFALADAQSWICPGCGNAASGNFCNSCGQPRFDTMKLLYDYEKTITVYYGANSRKYHADQACNMMYDAKYEHTLYEALHIDFKDRCGICNPLTEEQAKTQMKK